MALTTEQETVLSAALKAETDPTVIAALAIRDDVTLHAFCNSPSTVDAWNETCSAADMFEAMDVSKFDNLSAGKRDAWRLLLGFAPINFSRNANRKAVVDVWAATASKPGDDAPAVLAKLTRKATRAEAYFGGVSATSGTVTALKLNFPGQVSRDDVSRALNLNP